MANIHLEKHSERRLRNNGLLASAFLRQWGVHATKMKNSIEDGTKDTHVATVTLISNNDKIQM